jgi:hypothetical protein
VTGGLACLAGLALIAWRWPALGRFEAEDAAGAPAPPPAGIVSPP